MQRDETPVEVDPIAIVGTALSFPGATDLTRYWEMLRDGQEAVRFFSEEEMRRAGVKPARLAEPNYVRAKGVIEDAEYFDAALFGMSADRATVMDPQHRLFIQKCWAALDDAGVDPERFGGPIGLFGGCAINTYLLNNLRHADRALTRRFHQIEFLIMTDKDFLTTQTSYLLGLEGPSVTVQTACSTALVAVHYACESLLSGETDLALAGAATVYAPQVKGYLYEEGSIVSDDGHVRSFDAKGRGTVYSSGVAVVVLKRLSDALRDGDRVHAVIRATAVNNDGRRKGGFRMPSAEGMAEAGAQALRLSGVEPARIGMIEANGSATPLGDPIEIAALDRVYGPGAAGPGTIPIGSVKSNIGHMNVTAGMGALLKTVAALRHGKVPPSLNYETPNPQIDFARTPFRVATTLEDWPAIEGPRVAAVNVYGVGGTNAHAILEEAPPVPARAPSPVSEQLLVVSAGSEAALARACADLEAALATDPSLDLDDVAATLERGRRRMTHRRAAVARRDATGAIGLAWGEAAQAPAATLPAALVLAARAPAPARLAALAGGSGLLATHLREALAAAPEIGAFLATGAEPDPGAARVAAAVCGWAAARALIAAGAELDLVAAGADLPIAAAACGALPLPAALEACRILAADPRGAAARLVATFAAASPAAEGPALWTLDGRELWAPGATLDAQALAEATLQPSASDVATLDALRAASRGILLGLDADGCDVAATLDALAEDAGLLRVLGALWARGGRIDPGRRCGERPLRRVGLPAYPFERARHWVDIPAEARPSNYDVAL